VPLPAKVEDTEVAQRRSPECEKVVMAHTVPMLAGQPMVIGWYVAMAGALKAKDEERVWKLFEPALSVPIRLRLCLDEDTCQLAGLFFNELMFAGSSASGADSFWIFSEKVAKLTRAAKALADQVSTPKFREAIGQYRLTFKREPLTDNLIKALKGLSTFVVDKPCGTAYRLMEVFCPELREPTLLMRICQLCQGRPVSTGACANIFDCLRVFRLTGGCIKEDAYTVSKVTGQEKNTPALVHELFKNQDVIEFILHEAELAPNKGVAR